MPLLPASDMIVQSGFEMSHDQHPTRIQEMRVLGQMSIT